MTSPYFDGRFLDPSPLALLASSLAAGESFSIYNSVKIRRDQGLMSGKRTPPIWSIILIAFGLALGVLGFEGVFTFAGCGPGPGPSLCIRVYSLDLAAFLMGAACVLIGIFRLARRFRDLQP